MANVNPPVKAQAWAFDVELEDYANPGLFKANPTLAAGDVKISKDNGAEANLASLPTVSPAGSRIVSGVTTGTEMDADKVTITLHDQTVPPEWADYSLSIATQSPVMEQGVVEGTITLKQAVALFLSVLTGKSSGGGTATVVFRDTADSKNRLSVTVDADGNRTAVGTRDGT